MSLKPGNKAYVSFELADPSAGVAANADSVALRVVRNDIDTDITPVPTNPSAGVYKANFTIPSTWAAGDIVSVRVLAIFGTGAQAKSYKRTVWQVILEADPAAVPVGVVQVDHNYGGTDVLAIEDDKGRRVDNATIMAFRAADWAAGNRDVMFAVDTTTTNVNGRWVSPLVLDPADYVLFVFRQGVVTPKAFSITVE